MRCRAAAVMREYKRALLRLRAAFQLARYEHRSPDTLSIAELERYFQSTLRSVHWVANVREGDGAFDLVASPGVGHD